jgi:PhnB protein
VEDVDALVAQAVDAGARVTLPVEDKFYGDRYGRVADPFGHEWQIATHIEDRSPDEIAERGTKAMIGPS